MPERTCFQLRCSAPRMNSGDEGEIMLYGEIVEDYGKWWKENYPEDKSASDFDRAIKKVKQDGARSLLLRINSPGGIVTQAVAMRTMLTAAGFEHVTVRIEGLCASAATFLATFPGAHVQIGAGAEYMIHNPWGGCFGGAADLENYAARLRKMEQTSREFYSARTGQSDETIKGWMDADNANAEEGNKKTYSDYAILMPTNTEVDKMVQALSHTWLAAEKVVGDSKVISDNPAVRVMTLHRAKGLEFSGVVLVASQGKWPRKATGFNSLSDLEKESLLAREKSLLYVGMTRAISHVLLTGLGEAPAELRSHGGHGSSASSQA